MSPREPRRAAQPRWTDGSTWLWVARVKTSGTGEGSSGLRSDVT
jgi:hypothetical protein